jgi:FkbM family methyltransferase
MNTAAAPRVIRTLVFGVLIADAAFVAAFFFRSECSLKTWMTESGKRREAPPFESLVSLKTTDAGSDLWDTPQGPLWTVQGDRRFPFLLSEQYLDVYEPAGHTVHQGDVVLDCGANIGVFTRKALSRGAKLVVAIEPAPLTLKALRRNFEREINDGRVIVYPKGVWDHDDEMELSVKGNPEVNTLVMPLEGSVTKVRVPLVTIDEIVAELKLPRVDFIKMDIEGAEKPALQGARRTIRQFKPRMSLSAEHLEDDSTAIPALVQSIEPGYTWRGCDCEKRWTYIKATVLAFDPPPGDAGSR